jgi:hypothetical protein
MTPNVRFISRALILALLLWAAPAMAADVDGKWAGTVSTPGGDFPVTFEFKADGTKLTGTTMSPDGGSVNIKDGKIDGNKISFGVSLDFGGMANRHCLQRCRVAHRGEDDGRSPGYADGVRREKGSRQVARSDDADYRIANGLPGDPVAPFSRSGANTNANSDTLSRARSSVSRFSKI